MTAELCKTVASSCASALAALEADDAAAALLRAQQAMAQLRAQCAPTSRHRRLAETAFDLTQAALEPLRRFQGASEDEGGSADELRTGRRAKARRAIDRALSVH